MLCDVGCVRVFVGIGSELDGLDANLENCASIERY